MCISSRASGQDLVSPSEVELHTKLVREKAFTQCGNTSYLGILGLPVLSCMNWGKLFSDAPAPRKATICQAVTHYRLASGSEAKFYPAKKDPTAAESANGVEWSGYLTVEFDISQTRHIADGVWGPWEEWIDNSGPRVSRVLHFWKKNGVWSDEVGPDLFKLPIPINKMITGKPSCADITNAEVHNGFAAPTNIPVRAVSHGATGHSLSDNYARAVQLIDDNKVKGIIDAIGSVGWLQQIDVCYSITQTQEGGSVNRKCDKTGETVRVPGDIEASPAFWTTLGPRCKEANMGGVEVKLNPASGDGRKRFIACGNAFVLSAERDQMIAKGIK
jgi:hypothetical protein